MFGSGAATDAFVRQVQQKTGLQGQGDKFVGQFQGLWGWAQSKPVSNTVGSLRGGNLLGGIGGLIGGSAGGMLSMMTGGSFFMKHDFVIELQGYNLPGASIRQASSFLSDKTHEMRPAIGQKASSGVGWIDSKFEVCANDPQFVQYICGSSELQEAIKKWPAPLNLSWYGKEIWLEILDSPQRINSWFGATQQQNGDLQHLGMCVVAAAARATFSR